MRLKKINKKLFQMKMHSKNLETTNFPTKAS